MKSFIRIFILVIATAGLSGAIPFAFWKPAIAPGGGGGGGPTLIASDNFDSYGGGSALASAANWDASVSSTINITKPASDGSVSSGSSTLGGVYYSGAAFNADQRAEVTIDTLAAEGTFDYVGPAVRCQAGAMTCYGVAFSSQGLRLFYLSAGVRTNIITDVVTTWVVGNKVAIEASGTGAATRLKVQVDTGSGWVDKWTNQDPALDIDGGKPGVVNYSQSGTGVRLDDWFGYNL